MRIRYRQGGRPLTAHLERKMVLAVRGADPYGADDPETFDDLEIVAATRVEREELRKAGFAIRVRAPITSRSVGGHHEGQTNRHGQSS